MSIDRPENDREIYRLYVDPETTDPNVAVLEAIADIKNASVDELTPLWSRIDHVIEHIFSDPPTPDARVRISFDYEGYRISINQDGTLTIVEQE